MSAGCSATGCSATLLVWRLDRCSSFNVLDAAVVLVQEGAPEPDCWSSSLSILVNIGMWFERFVIVVGSLYQDFLPANWGYYNPTWVDVCTYLGTFGAVFHAVPVVRPVPADDRRFGGQGRHAAGRPASSAGRRERRRSSHQLSTRKPTASSPNSNRPPRSCTRRRRSATPASAAGTCSRRSRFTAWTR